MIMVICFLAFALYALFILWCLSDRFRFAVLSRIMLRRLKKRLKEGFFKIQVAELGFEKFEDKEDKEMFRDVLLTEMNKINEDYKFYMCPIYDDIKASSIFKFIYEDKFNECIETAHELERQCNDVITKYF